MPFNTRGGVELPLEVMGSWCTEMAPIDLPKGVSPDNQEMTFVPGNTGTRPAFQKELSSPFPSGGPSNLIPTVVYAKSFVTPTGGIKNFYFDSNGILWIEDVINSPGVYTQLFASTPGSYCRSTTAFGREYFAVSDGLHGADIPFQYDGTFLDRVTMDGPGAPPTVTSIALPASTMAIAGAGPGGVAVTSITASSPYTVWEGPGIGYVTYYNTVTFQMAAPFTPAGNFTISGNSQGAYNITYSLDGLQVISASQFILNWHSYPLTSLLVGTGGTTGSLSSLTTMTRLNNSVYLSTMTAHGLIVGNQAQISAAGTLAVGGGIVSIVINNEDDPGLATVTMNAAHGLQPQNQVTITGVSATAVGGGIVGAVREGDSVTVTFAAPHGLIPGINLLVAMTGGGDASFNGTFPVSIVPSPTTVVYIQVDSDATSGGGGIGSIAWPIPDNTPTPTYFEVVSAPTALTFQIQVSYADGTWTSGIVQFPWDGTFFVTAVPSSTSLVYQQYGPNGTNTTVGTVTPWGQAAPGLHVCQVLWVTRQYAVSEPSPPTTFIANGGQYVSVTNIPLGPANVIARILAFSGAQPNVPGSQPPMFYLPVPANVTGLVVSTATQLNDNATTSAVFDFSDNSLFTGLGISVPGNNLRTQIVLDGALGFGSFDTRLTTWGQRNRIQNFLNLGFEGGYLSTSPNVPLGWSLNFSSGLIVAGRIGSAWQMPVGATGGHAYGQLLQSAYLDAYGVPIITGNLTYKVRLWLKPSAVGITGPAFQASLFSLATSFTVTANIANASMSTSGSWLEATFTGPIPVTVPADLQLEIAAISGGAISMLVVDEISVIPIITPYTDTVAYGSYGNNPEGIDGLSGKFGASGDTHKLMDMGYLRSTLYLLTQDPSGRIHETSGSDVTEPSGWVIEEVDANCGALSAFTLTKSQADDSSASGGEEWMAWASESGARIFGGGTAHKISQEIQSAWSGAQQVTAWPQINMQAALTISAVNDPVERCIYFFLPIGNATAPSQIYPISYRELDTAEAIASAPPFHPSLAGRLIATDNTRKWTHWLRAMSGASRMYRQSGSLTMIFWGGNGQTPGAAAGFGNVYSLNASKFTDDDFGQITSWYVTYAFPAHDEEQGLQLGSHRKILAYFIASVAGVGQITITPLLGSLNNPSSIFCTRNLSSSPNYDLEWTGASVTASRMFFKFQSLPLSGQTDNAFSLEKCIPVLRPAARLPVRGAA